jgi:hypothetical protein
MALGGEGDRVHKAQIQGVSPPCPEPMTSTATHPNSEQVRVGVGKPCTRYAPL